MKLGLVSGLLYAIACIAAAIVSARIDGMGTGGLAILLCGVSITVGVYVQRLRPVARVIAMLSAVLALLAAALLIVAATIGGSFNLPGEQAALAGLFVAIGVFGILFSSRTKTSGEHHDSS